MYLFGAIVMLLALTVFTEVSGYNVFEVEKLCFDNGNAFKQAADDSRKYSCKLYCQCPSDTNFTGVSIRNCELCCCIIGKIHRIKGTELKTVKNDYENAIKQRNKQIQHMTILSDNKTTSLHECQVKLIEKDFQQLKYRNHTEVNASRNKIELSKCQDSLSKTKEKFSSCSQFAAISYVFNVMAGTTVLATVYYFYKKRRKLRLIHSFNNKTNISQQLGFDNQINVQINVPKDDKTSNRKGSIQQNRQCKQEKEENVLPDITSYPEQESREQIRTRKQESDKIVIPEITTHPEQESREQIRTRKQESEKHVIPEITSHPDQETPELTRTKNEEKVILAITSHADEETLELKEIPSSSSKKSTKKNDISSCNQQTSLNSLNATSFCNHDKKERPEGASLSHQKKEKSFDITSHLNQETCQQLEIQPSSNDENKAKTYLSENSNKTNVRENIASIDIISNQTG